MSDAMKKYSNGVMPLSLGWMFGKHDLKIWGGPFDNRAKIATIGYAVCVRSERVPAFGVNAHLPIRDFHVPDDDAEVQVVLKSTLKSLLQGDVVYVGCMAGLGRTGLFLALLAKAAGIEDPVGHVRSTYTSHAVETRDQERYVNDFHVGNLTSWLRKEGWKRRVRSLFGRT